MESNESQSLVRTVEEYTITRAGEPPFCYGRYRPKRCTLQVKTLFLLHLASVLCFLNLSGLL